MIEFGAVDTDIKCNLKANNTKRERERERKRMKRNFPLETNKYL